MGVGEVMLRLGRAQIERARAQLHAKTARLPFAGAFKQIVEALFVLHVPGGTRAGNVVTASRVLAAW